MISAPRERCLLLRAVQSPFLLSSVKDSFWHLVQGSVVKDPVSHSVQGRAVMRLV